MAMCLIIHDVLTFGWKEITRCWWSCEVCFSGKVFLHMVPTVPKLLASLLAVYSKKHLLLKLWQCHGNWSALNRCVFFCKSLSETSLLKHKFKDSQCDILH